jgi:hypothetical protein
MLFVCMTVKQIISSGGHAENNGPIVEAGSGPIAVAM